MYIPPSQYKTGFYSNGDYVDNQNNPYTGPFYKVKNGKIFTGESPNTNIKGNNIQIFLISSIQNTNPILIPNTTNYTSFITPVVTNSTEQQIRTLPIPYFPQLSQMNIDEGIFTRYFLKRNDKFLYIEINSKGYNNISTRNPSTAWDLYDSVSLPWRIKGDQFNINKINKKTILEIESKYTPFSPNGKNWVGFSQIFKDNYLQFYQGVRENLSTDGRKYKTSDEKEYIGPYHIHPEKGPMVGPTHLSTSHGYLYPIKRKITQKITGSISPSTPSYTPPPTTGGSGY